MKKLFLLLTLLLSMGTTMSADNFVLCTNAAKLQEGAQIYIGNADIDPQTVMGDALNENTKVQPAETATIVDGVVTDPGNGVLITLVAGTNGKWILRDSEGNFMYTASNGTMFKAEQKAEYTIEIADNGEAKIYWTSGAGWAYYIVRQGLTGIGTNGYGSSNMGADGANRLYPQIYIKESGETPDPVVTAPEDVTFSVEGEVEAGTVVTVTAVGATHISYTFNDKTGEADAETIEVTINEAGTLNVTASNEGGSVTGSAEYTIKAVTPDPTPGPDGDVIYKTLQADQEEIGWDLSDTDEYGGSPFYWYSSQGERYFWVWGEKSAVAFDPTAIALPTADEVVITATFEQNESVAGSAFLVRENGTTDWTELAISESESRAEVSFSTAYVNLSDFAGKTVQIGLKYPGDDVDWMVKNIVITAKMQTAISSVSVDENADAVYYNLQGMRVNADAMTPGIYVRLQGKTATKVMVR